MRTSYRDREAAGEVLAEQLAPRYAGNREVAVLGLVRGGVPVAAVVAARLAAPLDVLVVRKLGVPGAEEVALGALGPGGVLVRNEEIARLLTGAQVAAVQQREAAELARRRAPGLIEEYREIGGSPLNAQAAAQASALERELCARGHDCVVIVAMQFTEPGIPAAVERARAAGIDRLVGLPVYPLCGATTTAAALMALDRARADAAWDIELLEISGWHPDPRYIALRAEGIRAVADEHGLDLDRNAMLVFSAHGTPLKYLRKGNRYDVYVHDCCARVAEAAGAERYVIGYQNHTNRPIEWTQPDVADAVRAVDAESVVVVPISFMHEQSETLAELDIELREVAEDAGLRFYRVPVPHDDPRFTAVLADLVESRIADRLLACDCCPRAACLARAV